MKVAVLQVLPFVLLSVNADFNPQPCMSTNHTSGHRTFLARHVLKSSPETLDAKVWEEFLRNHSFCHRPTQSFLPYREKEEIDAVCSPAGGRLHTRNLCISRKPFSFITVKTVGTHLGSCNVSHVDRETKHIILACETIKDICVPVHFEGNPDQEEPRDDAPDCQSSPPASSWSLKAHDSITLLCFFLCSVLLWL
ncbi:angiogenin-like [Scleropages formosus]|uniref:Angiogenin-like n=1 Tax=Scleropages formosus TaxID=113540 RepID=A0A0N8JVQ2_SCLFO|nr:angiogenin-like [Scleropages formosus]